MVKHYKISVCKTKACSERFSADTYKAFEQLIAQHGLTGQVELASGGCYGRWGKGPNVITEDSSSARQVYNGVQPSDCEDLLLSHCVEGKVFARLQEQAE